MSKALVPRSVIVLVPGYVPPIWAWLRRCAAPVAGQKVSWVTLYGEFISGWSQVPEERRPTAKDFGQALKYICERASIRIEIDGPDIYCADLQLIIEPPTAKLPAPSA